MSDENKNSDFSFENPEYRKTYWHTCSHVMAQAVKRKRSTVPPCLHPSGMPLVSSVTGGPVPAYISVGGSKAVAVPRAATGTAFSQRRPLSAVMPGQRPFQCLFSTVHHITCPPLCQAGSSEIPFQSRRGGSKSRGFHQTASGSKATGYRMADPPCKSFSVCRPRLRQPLFPLRRRLSGLVTIPKRCKAIWAMLPPHSRWMSMDT